MIVRLHYADGQTEDHKLLNGEHFADYIRRVDVPGSKFAFDLRGRQIRYLAVQPAAARPDHSDRAGQRRRPHGPRGDGGDGGDAVTDCIETRCYAGYIGSIHEGL